MAKKFVVRLRDVDKSDIDTVGGKGANLGEMTQAGFPVPTGFIVTSAAYNQFLQESSLRDKLRDILVPLDVSDNKALNRASKKIEQLIRRARFPKDVAK